MLVKWGVHRKELFQTFLLRAVETWITLSFLPSMFTRNTDLKRWPSIVGFPNKQKIYFKNWSWRGKIWPSLSKEPFVWVSNGCFSFVVGGGERKVFPLSYDHSWRNCLPPENDHSFVFFCFFIRKSTFGIGAERSCFFFFCDYMFIMAQEGHSPESVQLIFHSPVLILFKVQF